MGPSLRQAALAFAALGAVAAAAALLLAGRAAPTWVALAEAAVVGLSLLVATATVVRYRSEHRRGERALRLARSLERIATELGEVTDPGPLFQSIARSALVLVGAQHATVSRRRGEEFEVVAGAGTGERVIGTRTTAGGGIVGAVLRSREPVTWSDYATSDGPVEALRATGVRSVVAVPLMVQGELVATLVVARNEVRPFDREDVRALTGLAAHGAVALRNARLLELSRRLEGLSRDVAAGPGTLPEIMRRVASEVAAAYEAEVVSVVRLRGEQSVLLAQVGADPPREPVSRPGPLTAAAAERREVVSVRDYSAAYGASDHPGVVSGLRVGLHAAMAAPVAVDGEIAAVLTLGTTDPHRSFGPGDRQGLAAFAQVAGAALRAVVVRDERERRIGRLSTLNVLAWQLAALREHHEIARLAYEAVGEMLPREAFYVARVDAERRELDVVLEADGGDVWRGERGPLGSGLIAQVARSGEARVCRGGRTVAHVPLKSRGRLVGVLGSAAPGTQSYDDEDVVILQSLANLVATAFDNAESMAQMRELYLASVKALAAAVDARDPYTRSHSARVAALARTIAEEMRLGPDGMRRVQLGALLHDIGKIGIPDAILNKPGPLTEDEWVLMRTHPSVGASILGAVEPLRDLVPIVRAHHERYDGRGYPERVGGEAVALESYVVAAADAFEVIVSRRAYKQAQTVEVACAELRRFRGTQFHPDVVDAFLRVVERDQQQGAALLRRIGAIEQEEYADVPGPAGVLEQFAASAHTHGRQLAILQRLATEISAVLDIDELAARLLRIVCDAMGYENAFLLTLDDVHANLVVRAAVGPSEPYVGQLLPADTGISWWVVTHGLPQLVQDAQRDPRFYGPPEISTALVVPLQIGEERVGALGVESTRQNAFDREDEELLTAVSHQVAAALRVARLHQEAKVAAATDPLTGLANRRTFFERLRAELARDPSAAVSVAVLDVNDLKKLNDGHGHAAGDEALVRIGALLTAGVREQDLVARIGGDEFAVLFAGAPLLAAERVMRRVADTIASTTGPADRPLPSIAWGVADATARALTVDELVDAADRAMYRQKQRERETVRASAIRAGGA